MSGFEMAFALLARAKYHRGSIGDHGDPYEEALLSGTVSYGLKVIVKEIFDHLRSALDYSAREICLRCQPGMTKARIYFPIAGKAAKRENFRGVLGKVMPGVLDERPDLAALIESFQVFSPSGYTWLPDFATLCNESKHEQLTVAETDVLDVAFKRDTKNIIVASYRKSDGTPFSRSPLMLLSDFPTSGEGAAKAKYVSLAAVDEELLFFLDQVLQGVERMVASMEDATAPSNSSADHSSENC